MFNAAVWLGAAVFFTAGAAPALSSDAMHALLGPKFFPFYSGAVTQLVLARCLEFHVACGVIALIHLFTEGFYLGRPVRRWWLGLLAGLLALGLVGRYGLAPRLAQLHRTQHAVNVQPEQRTAAVNSFRVWHGAFQVLNLLLLAGVAVHFWRVTHPEDPLRFVGASKFRS